MSADDLTEAEQNARHALLVQIASIGATRTAGTSKDISESIRNLAEAYSLIASAPKR